MQNVFNESALVMSKIIVLLVFLAITMIEAVKADGLTKCLKMPESNEKNYIRYENKLLNLTIQTSPRPAHQVTSHILKILLEEAMDYANVEVVPTEKSNVENVTMVLSGIDSDVSDIPKAMVNLEVWIPPDMDTVSMLRDTKVTDCGKLRSSIKFGWHIPKELIQPITNYDNKWTAETGIVPWSFFLDATFSSQFHIENKQDVLTGPNKTSIHNCTKDYCDAIPSICNTNKCATVLLPSSENYCTDIQQLLDSNMYVELSYLGYHLKKTMREIKTSYKENNISKSLILSAWTPSELKLSNENYVKIAFKNDMPPFSCKHDTMRMEKFAWNKLEKLAPSAYKAILNMQFSDEEFLDLLKIYNQYQSESYEDMACRWLKKHKSYKNWYSEETVKKIYIGGIFPIKKKSYKVSSIIFSANRAITKINANQTLLKGYTLELLKHDGQCNAETVIRRFIDYVGDNSQHYNNIVGILGPACSDTVEPLAGVSKHYNTLMISYGAEGASFSNRDKYPYFFRTIASNDEFKYVYLKLFEKFGWRRLATLTEDGQKYTEYILHTQSLLEANGITVVLNAKFATDQKNVTMRKYLEDIKAKGARIIIADVFDSIARSVMCYAEQMNMTMKHGYVWFLPTWLDDTWYNTTLYNNRFKENVSCTTEVMVDAINGYFSLSPSFWGEPDSKIPENVTVSQWLTEVKRNYRNDLSNYAGFAYDAVWTYALALDKVLKSNPEAISDLHSINTTSMLVDAIENLDFNGVSGNINFHGGSSRYSRINLNQWTKQMNTTTFGYFQPDFENASYITGGELILNESSIIWFAGVIPNDGSVSTTRCSLESLAKSLNVGCEMAIVIVCFIVFSLLLTVLALWIFSYKFKVDTKMFKTRKIIKSLGLDYGGEKLFDLDKFVISKDNVIINRKLGEGSFGTVYGGEALIPEQGWLAVAVKTLRTGSNIEDKVDFLAEAEAMSRFDHKNIIKLIGVSVNSEPVYTVIEFMLYGDLKTYLLSRRNCPPRKLDEDHEVSSKQLTSMALDVARALSYLEKMKHVHRDVACKNCLVNAEKMVKLSDFSMTTGTFDRTNRNKDLPVRWMSPESLTMGIFTPSSDIWSYGILLYEMITFGNIPYQGMSNNQVLEYVKKGLTLDMPSGVNPQLEALLRTCWSEDYKKRPTACDLVTYLETNPELLSACIEGPLASVLIDDIESIVHFPRKLKSSSCVTFINPTFSKCEALTDLPKDLRNCSIKPKENYYSSMIPFKFNVQPYNLLTDETNIECR